MITVWWTERAQDDLAAIHAFVSQNSPHYATVVVDRLITAVDQIPAFPVSGRAVPEFDNPSVREIIRKPYRIVYRLVSEQDVHVYANTRERGMPSPGRSAVVSTSSASRDSSTARSKRSPARR